MVSVENECSLSVNESISTRQCLDGILSARCCIIPSGVWMSSSSIAQWEIWRSLSCAYTKCHFIVVALWTWSNRRTTETQQKFPPIRTNHARLSANIYTRCGETELSFKRDIHEYREFTEPLLNYSLNRQEAKKNCWNFSSSFKFNKRTIFSETIN